MEFAPLRNDFPILSTTVHGKPLIYLDNAATTQMPEPVLSIIAEQHRLYEANVHRGIHTLSEKSTARMESARQVVQRFINARRADEIIFTSGTTAAINLVARSFCDTFVGSGDEIITTAMEHHSNFVPWQQAAKRLGAEFKVVPFDSDGNLRIDVLSQMLSPKTKIVAVCAVSNVLGTVNPLRKIILAAHQVGAKVLVDFAQGVRHDRIDVQALDCDFIAFSGHKIMGPTGTGVLYGKAEILEKMSPVEFGGGMVDTVHERETTFGDLPFKFEAGTPNIVGNIALGAALEYYEKLGAVSDYETQLLQYTEEKLCEIPEVTVLGNPHKRSGVISFNMDGVHPYDVAALLDRLGIAVRSGHHCAQPLLECYGLTGAVRVSPAFYNTHDEIDTLINGIKRIIPLVKGNR